MADDAINDFTTVLIDPEDDGFYKSKAKQWSTLCPHMSPTDHRVFTLLLDLCSAKANVRRLTITEIAAMLPAGKAIAIGEEPRSVSVSTIARSINALSEIGQITDRDGGQIRVSNKTRTDLVIAPWKSLRHECTASRNVYDALARARGATGDDGPRYPIGLGAAPNLVPKAEPAPNLVPAAPDLVPTAPDLVPTPPETPATTSKNREESISPSSLPVEPTHTPARAREADSTTEPQTETSVCVDNETMDNLKETLRANLIDRPTASLQREIDDGPKIAIRDLAVRCLRTGATVEDIDASLSKAINNKTEYPYTHGTKALNALLARKQGKEDPLGTSTTTETTEPNSWVDPDGFEWPHLRPDQRKCRGESCGDYHGQRYVAVEERFRDDGTVIAIVPVGDAFSCPICKNHYKKEATRT